MVLKFKRPRADGTARGADGLDDLWQGQSSLLNPKNQLARDLIEVRAMWWRLRRQGVDLPAERGVIVYPNWWSR